MYVTRKNFIHRDIKPQNIVIDDNYRIKLLDFGIARVTSLSDLTQTGTSLGTPEYMASELFATNTYDPRTDISSVNSAENGGFPSLVEGLNHRIPLLEAQTVAQLEMAGANVGSDLESEFAMLESKGKVDDSLKALKEKMKAQPLLGASPVDKIDELKAKRG